MKTDIIERLEFYVATYGPSPELIIDAINEIERLRTRLNLAERSIEIMERENNELELENDNLKQALDDS